MGRHRTNPPGRRVAPRTRPRYGRIGAAGTSLGVTLVAVLGGIGMLPTSAPGAPAYAAGRSAPSSHGGAMRLDAAPRQRPTARQAAPTDAGASRDATQPVKPPKVPADSGSGKRVVFDMSRQRVWLVSTHDHARRTYLVSGSKTHNLGPGTYHVYSRSLHAIGVDDSGTMRYMVRFTQGANAAIGFHDIPVKDGHPLQTRSQLGTPQSHGCIRQWRPDARALWRFAPIGTTVVVIR
ncbi:MAG: L,D-transpeptidase [Nocardioidaceae bacterium]